MTSFSTNRGNVLADSLPLRGQRALVTGASRGLGREIALALGRAGADVALACRVNRQLAEEAAERLRAAGCRASVQVFDLAAPGAAEALVKEAAAALGGLDILVCNAAENLDRLILRTSEAEWDRIIAVNLTAPAFLCRAAAPYMLAKGRGHIVLVSSYSGLTGNAGQAAYGASKTGLIGLCRSLAAELGPRGVCINAILPGYLNTHMGSAAGAAMAAAQKTSLLGSLGDAAETSQWVVRLCASAKITGQVICCESRPRLRW
ncbi:MAG: SDR family oxidoreductase [Planctomycetota bacterium]|nr:SDR family oxidoreductase [Planctomycetota bacterium]